MFRLTWIRNAVLLTLATGALLAADVTGKWTATMGGPEGDRTITFDLKQDGATVSGTVDGPRGEALQVSDWKVEGDHISFTLTLPGGNGERKIMHEGTIADDEITLNTRMDSGPGPDGPDGPGPDGPGAPGHSPRPMTLKRMQ